MQPIISQTRPAGVGTYLTRVNRDSGKAGRFGASARSTGWFDHPAALAARDLFLPETPEGAILVHRHPESGNVGLTSAK
jgi:hypothetical protein